MAISEMAMEDGVLMVAVFTFKASARACDQIQRGVTTSELIAAISDGTRCRLNSVSELLNDTTALDPPLIESIDLFDHGQKRPVE